MSKAWWVSSERITCLVVTDDRDIVIDAAPILRKFIGQPAKNVGRWMRKQGGFRCARLS